MSSECVIAVEATLLGAARSKHVYLQNTPTNPLFLQNFSGSDSGGGSSIQQWEKPCGREVARRHSVV